MGSIIGGVIGGIGSLIGGNSSSDAADTAAQQSLTGYNYLTGNATNQQAQGQGRAAGNASVDTQNTEAQLLGTEPVTSATKNGFNNYLNSTGYNFQLDQGTRAITGSAASRGILNSGSTAKALTSYGQNLAGQSFNNYLNNLTGLNTQQQNTANAGIGAANNVGAAGSAGGSGAAAATTAGAAAENNAINTTAGIAGSMASTIPKNYFGAF